MVFFFSLTDFSLKSEVFTRSVHFEISWVCTMWFLLIDFFCEIRNLMFPWGASRERTTRFWLSVDQLEISLYWIWFFEM